ncbi:hypothetical protein [Myroides sp.]|uniref:hypothetical protein n=1 Tax=Myroides sp. TaxID=1874736 RepID=UPI003F373F68
MNRFVLLLLLISNSLYSFAQSTISATDKCIISEFENSEDFENQYSDFYQLDSFRSNIAKFNELHSAIFLYKLNTHGRYSAKGGLIDLKRNTINKFYSDKEIENIIDSLDTEFLLTNIDLLSNKNYIEHYANNTLEDFTFFIIKLDGILKAQLLILGKENLNTSTIETTPIKKLLHKISYYINQ